MIVRRCIILCLFAAANVFSQDGQPQQRQVYANQNPNVNLGQPGPGYNALQPNMDAARGPQGGFNAQAQLNPVNPQQQQQLPLRGNQPQWNTGVGNGPGGNVVLPPRIPGVERSSPHSVLISQTPQCQSDIERICPSELRSSNYNILACLSKRIDDTDLSNECHTYIWEYKVNMTTDTRFTPMLEKTCAEEIAEMKKGQLCGTEEETRKNQLSCLILYVNKLHKHSSDSACAHMLTRISYIVFSDYRLIGTFFEKCKNDVTKFKCGSIARDQRADHSQGYTIECLEEKINEVAPECKKVINDLAEAQAHDIQLDRATNFACKDDIKLFCGKLVPGTGEIYQCLMDAKNEPTMSPPCKRAISTREHLIVEDPMVNFPIREKCSADLERFAGDCNFDEMAKDHSQMASMLLCLEMKQRSAIAALSSKDKAASENLNSKPLTSGCVLALKSARKMLMSDYELNPGIVRNCGPVIKDHCNGGLQKGGKTLHCLMKLGQNPSKQFNMEELYPQCFQSVEFLIRSVNPVEDASVDRVLMEACKPVLDANCRDRKGKLDEDAIECLFDKMEDKSMTDDCAEVLLEISYFTARDWALDRPLYGACNQDAKKLCDVQRWASVKDNMAHGEIFACLYRHINHEAEESRLSERCTIEVVRVMKDRAVAVGLNPYLEYECRQDLAAYCSDPEVTRSRKELECLQDIYTVESAKAGGGYDKQLSPRCKQALKNYTKVETESVEINRKLYNSCKPMIERYCAEERRAAKNSDKQGSLFNCMIENKNMPDVEDTCVYGIEHMQLIQLKDFDFDRAFKKRCREDVALLCSTSKTKDEVVTCLSESIRNDKVQNRQVKVSEQCQEELKRPLQERYEDLKLDGSMYKVCKKDIEQFCKKVKSGAGRMLECLKDNKEDLSMGCRRRVFERQQEELEEPGHVAEKDFVLNKVCKHMIEEYCDDEENVLKCLWKHRQSADFDERCSKVVHKRMIAKGEDVRLNTDMFKACQVDIKAQCKSEIEQARLDSDDANKPESYQGVIINCLRLKFAERKLSDQCSDQVRQFIRTSAQEWKMDFRMRMRCGKVVKQLCADEKPNKVEECLKEKYSSGQITDVHDADSRCRNEIKRVLDEGVVDIHADPILQKTCSLDIEHLCSTVAPGNGRQVACMMDKLKNNDARLSTDCRKMLRERVEMWNLAGDRIHKIETLNDVIVQIGASSNRHYFLTIFGMLISVIFFGGLLFGRVTKRVAREVKSR